MNGLRNMEFGFITSSAYKRQQDNWVVRCGNRRESVRQFRKVEPYEVCICCYFADAFICLHTVTAKTTHFHGRSFRMMAAMKQVIRRSAAVAALAIFASACSGSGNTPVAVAPTVEAVSEPSPTAISPVESVPTVDNRPTPSVQSADESDPVPEPTAGTEGATTEVPLELARSPQVLCHPVVVHGETHETVLDDSDSDGEYDSCDLAHEHPHGDSSGPPPEAACNPGIAHGEIHETILVDVDGDGEYDVCDFTHEHPHETEGGEAPTSPTAEPVSVESELAPSVVSNAPEGWYADPACRHDLRWWAGQKFGWTEVVLNEGTGVAPDDPLLPSDSLAPPDAIRRCLPNALPEWGRLDLGPIQDACLEPAPAAEAGLGMGSDGLPCADRLLTRSELAATGLFWSESPPTSAGGYDWGYLQPVDVLPEIPDGEALLYITECVRLEPADGYPGPKQPQHSRFPEEASAVQTCNVAWQMAAGPINHAGMRPETRCVYETLHKRYHWGAFTDDAWDEETQRSAYGWAYLCPSSIDPDPYLPYLEKCRNLYGHYIGADLAAERLALYDQCSVYAPAEMMKWISDRGACGDRYHLVEMALLIFHAEARDLGLLPEDEGIVDFMHWRPEGDAGPRSMC